MISIEEVNKSILELEEKDTTFATCEKLAWLYIIKDHITDIGRKAKLQAVGKSEFMQAVDGKDETKVWSVIDELMSTLKVFNLKTYQAVIMKLENLD